MSMGMRGKKGGLRTSAAVSVSHSARLTPFTLALKRKMTPHGLAGTAMLASLAVSTSLSAAEVPFDANNIPHTATQVRATFSADLDGDGDLDVISASGTDDKISWHENNGGPSPSFTERVISTLANGASSVYAADVDGDGDIDVLSASSIDDKIAWYKNDGALLPGFELHTISQDADNPFSVFAADLDQDGDMDVLSASLNDNSVVWYENGGQPHPIFTARTISTLVDTATSVRAADLDADGDLDVVATSFSNDTLYWFESDGAPDPDFVRRTISTAVDGAVSVAIQDIDGDGDMDIVSGARESDTVAIHLNNGNADPFFTTQTISASIDAPYAVDAIDVDADGDMDVLAVAFNGNQVVWFENLGGAPNSFATHVISTGVLGPRSIQAADLNGDGDIDVLTASADGNTLDWFSNQTIHRSASFPQEIVLETGRDVAQQTIAVDLDGDGDLDIASASFGDDTLAWHRNDGASPFPSFSSITISTSEDGVGPVHAADLDADGDMDLLVGAFHADTMAWYQNDGAAVPNFTRRQISNNLIEPQSIFTADLDGDGDLDVLSASSADDKIAWYENNGASIPLLVIRTISLTADFPRSVSAADLDGDGDQDVISASLFDDKIAWYENDGAASPTFTLQTITTAANGAQRMMPSDLDSDGDIDIVLAAGLNNQITWLQNNGATNPDFTMRTVSVAGPSEPNSPNAVFIADLDGDGDQDILSASSADNKIAWYENNGGAVPVFVTHTISTNVGQASFVTAADLDGDGDVDVISSSVSGDRFIIHPNHGGQFALETFDLVPANVNPGDADTPVLRIDAAHQGRAGDSSVELTSFELHFDNGSGVALSSAQANALVDNLRVYVDSNTDGAFDPGSDTLVTTVSALSLTDGVQTIAFADGDANVTFAHGVAPTYFVAVDVAAEAHLQTPDRLRITHVTEASSTAEDAAEDLPLVLEFASNVTSGTVLPEADTTPDAFDLIDRTDRPTAARINSNTITVSGIDAPTPMTVTAAGTSERYEINGGPRQEGPVNVSNGDTVRVSVISPGAANTTRAVTVNIGGVEEVWNVTTGAVDETPGPINFNNVALSGSHTVFSNTVVLGNFNSPATIQLRGAGTAMYSLNGGPFTRADGVANPGDTVQLKMTSAAVPATRRAYLIVGRIRGRWEVVTFAGSPAQQ